jgi:hypothetical protein
MFSQNQEKRSNGSYLIFAPQFGQNLVPAATSVWHFEHLTVACKGVPQLEQNFVPAAFAVPHFEQLTPPA